MPVVEMVSFHSASSQTFKISISTCTTTTMTSDSCYEVRSRKNFAQFIKSLYITVGYVCELSVNKLYQAKFFCYNHGSLMKKLRPWTFTIQSSIVSGPLFNARNVEWPGDEAILKSLPVHAVVHA